jgi:hypothetical protein
LSLLDLDKGSPTMIWVVRSRAIVNYTTDCFVQTAGFKMQYELGDGREDGEMKIELADQNTRGMEKLNLWLCRM